MSGEAEGGSAAQDAPPSTLEVESGQQGMAGKGSGEEVADTFQEKSLFMGKNHWLRAAAIRVVCHRMFERVTTGIILLNCILLTLYRPTEDFDSKWNSTLDDIDKFFLAAFTVELLLNVIAMGAWRYVTDAWNFLDFVVVASGYAELGLGPGSSVSALRTFRVLRPLRTINSLPGLKLLVNTILGALPLMGNVLVLWVYLFLVFGILGTQMFGGELDKHCVPLTEAGMAAVAALPSNYTYHEQQQYVEELFYAGAVPRVLDYSNATEYDYCTVGADLGWNGHYCQDTEACIHLEDPDFGKTSFNNLLWSMLTVFVVVTLETWTTIMYATMRTTSGWALIFFYLVVFLGSFFMVNLALAVIADIYEENVEEYKEATLQEHLKLVALHEAEEKKRKLRVLRRNRSARFDLQKQLNSEEAKRSPFQQMLVSLRAKCAAIYDTASFTNATTALILGNTLVLSMEYHNMPQNYAKGLEVTNEVLTWLFVAEMLLKLVALGLKGYWKDSFNKFDTVVNIVSVVELYATSNGSLSALRAFRILRVMKIAGTSQSLKLFIETLSKTIVELGNFALIVALISFIFALLGMQTFGNLFHFEVCESAANPETGVEVVVCEIDSPRSNFDTLLWAFVTVLQIFTGEDWNSVMYSGMRAKGDAASLYFVFLVIIGNYIVMNLFIAILLSSFSSHREERYDAVGVMPTIEGGQSVAFSDYSETSGNGVSAEANETADVAAQAPADSSEGEDGDEKVAKADVENDAAFEDAVSVLKAQNEEKDEEKDDAAATMEKPNELRPLEDFTLNSFFVFSPESSVRRACYKLIAHPLFDNIILMCIMASSIIMATENPGLEDNQTFQDVVKVMDIIFTTIFAAEMVLKVTALGFYGEPGAYVTSGWNVLDALIVMVSVLSLALSKLDLEWVRAVRVLRVLRPLRMISRIPELRVVVNALLASFPGLGNVLLVMALNWVIFGILGMSLFMGKFYRCNDDAAAGVEECVGTYVDKFGFEQEREWANQEPNFDNIFFAMGALFEMSTSEGWLDLMYNGVDSTEVGKQPKQNNAEWAVIYFAAFMLSSFFFLLNLFIGIIMDNFAQLREANSMTSLFMSERQRMWVEVNEKLAKAKLVRRVDRPSNWRRSIYDLVQSPVFENAVLLAILLNVVFMATSHSYEPEYWAQVVEVANRIFTWFFFIEMVLKLIGLLPQNYVRDGWNNFDGVVVVVSLVGEFTEVGAGANVLRIFRLARALRLVKRFKSLMILFQTLLQALPILMNVGGLLFLLLFVFAVLGVQLFGKVNSDQEFLNADANFSNFGQAISLLFRMATGEAWNGVMRDVMTQPDDGVCSKEAGDCGVLAAPVYFFAFVISGSFVLLNLFLAVVLENYDNVKESKRHDDQEQDGTAVTNDDIDDFNKRWALFDKDATGWILVADLDRLLLNLPPPLGILGMDNSDRTKLSGGQLLSLQSNLKINVYVYPATGEMYCSYSDVLQKLTMYSFGLTVDDLPAQVLEMLRKEQDATRKKTTRKLVQKKEADSKRDLDVIRQRARGLERMVTTKSNNSDASTTGASSASSFALMRSASSISLKAAAAAGHNFTEEEMKAIALAQTFSSSSRSHTGNKGEVSPEIKRIMNEVQSTLAADPLEKVSPHELVLCRYTTQHVTATSLIKAYVGGWIKRRMNTEHLQMLENSQMLEGLGKGLDQLGFVLNRIEV